MSVSDTTRPVQTSDLQPGDEIVTPEAHGVVYDLVDHVEFPDLETHPGSVVGKVYVTRTTVYREKGSVRTTRDFFWSGLKAVHNVERTPEPAGCGCEGPLHYTSCWWCVSHDDGRDQATGDPAIDYPEPEDVPGETSPAPLSELDLPPLRKALPEAPRMTRAHFRFLADVIADLWPGDETTNTAYVAECFADALSDSNPRFDRDRFLAAAGAR